MNADINSTGEVEVFGVGEVTGHHNRGFPGSGKSFIKHKKGILDVAAKAQRTVARFATKEHHEKSKRGKDLVGGTAGRGVAAESNDKKKLWSWSKSSKKARREKSLSSANREALASSGHVDSLFHKRWFQRLASREGGDPQKLVDDLADAGGGEDTENGADDDDDVEEEEEDGSRSVGSSADDDDDHVGGDGADDDTFEEET